MSENNDDDLRAEADPKKILPVAEWWGSLERFDLGLIAKGLRPGTNDAEKLAELLQTLKKRAAIKGGRLDPSTDPRMVAIERELAIHRTDEQQEEEHRHEAERLALLPVPDQEIVLAIHRAIADNPKVPKRDREEANRRHDTLKWHLETLRKRKEEL